MQRGERTAATTASSAKTTATVIEKCPRTLESFAKDAILVRYVEVVETHSAKDATSFADLPVVVRILGLTEKDMFLSTKDSRKITDSIAYDSIQSCTVASQKYIKLTLAHPRPTITPSSSPSNRPSMSDTVVLCLSPFPENTSNDPEIVIGAIQTRCKYLKGRPVQRSDLVSDAVGTEFKRVLPPPTPAPPQDLYRAAPQDPPLPSPIRESPPALSFAAAPDGTVGGADSFFSANDIFRSVAADEWHALVHELYRRYNPSKVEDIPNILRQFDGKERQMVHGICKKYAISADVLARMLETNRSFDPLDDSTAAAASNQMAVTEVAASTATAVTHSASHDDANKVLPLPSPLHGEAGPTAPTVASAMTPVSQRPSSFEYNSDEELVSSARRRRATKRSASATPSTPAPGADEMVVDDAQSNFPMESLGSRSSRNTPQQGVALGGSSSATPHAGDEDRLSAALHGVADEGGGHQSHGEDAELFLATLQLPKSPIAAPFTQATDDAQPPTSATTEWRTMNSELNVTWDSAFIEERIAKATVDALLADEAHNVVASEEEPAASIGQAFTQYTMSPEEYAKLTPRPDRLKRLEYRRRNPGPRPDFEDFDTVPYSASLSRDDELSGGDEWAMGCSPWERARLASQERERRASHAKKLMNPSRTFGGGQGATSSPQLQTFEVRSQSPQWAESPKSAGAQQGRNQLETPSDVKVRTQHPFEWSTPRQPFEWSTPSRVMDSDARGTRPLDHQLPASGSVNRGLQMTRSDAATMTQLEEPPSPATMPPNNVSNELRLARRVDPMAAVDPLAGAFLDADERWFDGNVASSQSPPASLWNTHLSTPSRAVAPNGAHTPQRGSELRTSSVMPLSSRYFVAASATEQRRLLEPLRAVRRASPSSLRMDELVVTAQDVVLPLYRVGSAKPGEDVFTYLSEAYFRLNGDVQLSFLRYLSSVCNDPAALQGFLHRLAPLVGGSFESIVLSSGPIEVRVPRLLFEAAVVCWGRRSRVTLQVTSRFGAVSVDDASSAFLEFLDSYNYLKASTGTNSLQSSHHDRRVVEQLTPPTELGANFERMVQKARMRADIDAYGVAVGHRPGFTSLSLSSALGGKMFVGGSSATKAAFTRLWEEGNVLVRSVCRPSAWREFDRHNYPMEHPSDPPADTEPFTVGTCSVPLSEWNDAVSQWNAMQ